MPKTALVTGANRGIGLELVRALCARGDGVIAACRSESVELRSLDGEVEEGVDVTSDDSVSVVGAWEGCTWRGSVAAKMGRSIAGPGHTRDFAVTTRDGVSDAFFSLCTQT